MGERIEKDTGWKLGWTWESRALRCRNAIRFMHEKNEPWRFACCLYELYNRAHDSHICGEPASRCDPLICVCTLTGVPVQDRAFMFYIGQMRMSSRAPELQELRGLQYLYTIPGP